MAVVVQDKKIMEGKITVNNDKRKKSGLMNSKITTGGDLKGKG